MAIHVIFGLLILAFGISLVVGAITNANWFARGALGRNGRFFWTEQEQAQVIKNVGHSMGYRLVFGTLGVGLVVAAVVWMFRI